MKLEELAFFTVKVEEMTRFYQRLLGVEPEVETDEKAVFSVGDVEILVHEDRESGPGQPPCEDHHSYSTEDLEETIKELVSRGFFLEVEPKRFDWGRSAYLRDPDGRLVEIHESSDE